MSLEESIFMARVAEQAERFDDMVHFLTPVLEEKGSTVSNDDRNLLSVAFKNLINSKRTAIRTITAIEQNPKYTQFSSQLATYKKKIEDLLYKDCDHIISLTRSKVLNNGRPIEDEARAFFVKLIGDYYRYIAESATGDRYEAVKQEALKAYTEANKITLPPCNSIRLGLALNFSVFYYEVMKDQQKACELADSSLQAALEKIDDLGEEEFRDAKSIIELLKENLSLWREENGDNNVDDL